MANIKTLIDTNRLPLNLDRYDVAEVMPGHYDELYPNLSKFLEMYYESLEEDGNPAKLVNDLLTNRDVVSVQQEFLKFLSNELLLGKPYFEQFNDKRTALQFSNLLYRSKGTEYSIQQFFRIFYTLDVDVFYGRDYIFNIGDPIQEKLQYPTRGELSGSTFRYTFQGGKVDVYVDIGSDEWVRMRQDIDYIQNFSERRVEFLVRPLDQKGNPIDGLGFVDDITGNPILTSLAETATIGYEVPASERLRIITTRRDTSVIGSSSSKRITNDKFYQLFALMIQTPVSTDVWKEAYKTFVHPAGMYLAGRVQIVSVYDMGMTGETLLSTVAVEPDQPVASVFRRGGKGLLSTDITERGPGPFGYQQRSRHEDLMRDTNHWQISDPDPLKIGTHDSENATGWGQQYYQIYRANDINARTLDDTYVTLTNTINTLDENVYTGQDSDGQGNPWLPGTIEIRPEDVLRIISTEDGTFIQTEDGRLIKI